MGAGKTAVGKRLAESLGCEFVDLDDLIEDREGRKINEIFAQHGEPYFRKIEKQVTIETAKRSGLVIACGGGVVLNKENVEALKASGVMIYLKATPELILERTKNYKHRPLLNVDNPKKRIEELLEYRAPYYAQADVIIDTDKLSIDEVVDKILAIVKKNG